MYRLITARVCLFFAIVSILIAGCQPQKISVSHVTVVPETGCEVAERATLELWQMFEEGGRALKNGDASTYETLYQQAIGYDAGSSQEGIAYKEIVIDAFQLYKRLLQDPDNVNLKNQWTILSAKFRSGQEVWVAKACTDKAEQADGQGQPGQGSPNVDGPKTGSECETARRAITELTQISVEAIGKGSSDAWLAKAKGVDVGTSREGVAYKDALVAYTQSLKASIADPANMDLREEVQKRLGVMQSAQTEWGNRACGTEGPIGQTQGQGQPSQEDIPDQSGRDNLDTNDPSGVGSCDPVATDRFWYDKLAPANIAVETVFGVPPDITSAYGNYDGNTSEEELRQWMRAADEAIANYRFLESEAASICSQMKDMFEMWEDGMLCTRINYEEIYRNPLASPVCDGSQFRHPDQNQTFGALLKASGVELFPDGVRR